MSRISTGQARSGSGLTDDNPWRRPRLISLGNMNLVPFEKTSNCQYHLQSPTRIGAKPTVTSPIPCSASHRMKEQTVEPSDTVAKIVSRSSNHCIEMQKVEGS